MANASVDFSVPVPFQALQGFFNAAIEHWVVNVQRKTSGLTKGVMAGAAIGFAQQGNGFGAGLALGLANGQGVQHPTSTSSCIQIPASMSTYGGEMTATALPGGDGQTNISISGKVQGLFSGAATENVNSLRDYLILALPEIYAKTQEAVSVHDETNIGLAGEITRLADLRNKGLIDEDEFVKAKKKLLS